jgi:hypothetical protein
MTKNAEKLLMLFKIEGTEGTDAAPVVGTDAILTRNLDASKWEGDKDVRQLDGLYAGARPSYYKQIRKPASWEVEIAGSGVSAVTVPAWMKLNRICGFDAGVAGGSSVVQTPIFSAIPTATIYPYYDNLLVNALGSRSNLGLTFEDDQIPFFNYDALGFPPAGLVSESAPGAPTLTGFAAPVLVNTANTTFSFGGYVPGLRKLTLDLGVKLEPRSLTGPVDRIMWRNREATGRLTIEHPDLASKNYFTNILARSIQVLSLVHGTVAGNIFQLDAARCEVDLPELSNEQGALMQSMPIRLLPTAAGNDEITFTSK